MKKVLVIALAVAFVFSITGSAALATTDIWKSVQNRGGYVKFCETTEINDLHPLSDPADFHGFGVTVIRETVTNDGFLDLKKAESFDWHELGGWGYTEFYEQKKIEAAGDTEMWKRVTATGGCANDFFFPLVVEVNTAISVDPFDVTVKDDWYTELNWFESDTYREVIDSDDWFFYTEKIGVNAYPCDYDPGKPPNPPKCHLINPYDP